MYVEREVESCQKVLIFGMDRVSQVLLAVLEPGGTEVVSCMLVLANSEQACFNAAGSHADRERRGLA